MADLSDVEIGLRDLIEGIVYPNGLNSPSAITAAGYASPINCRVFPGWPLPGQIDADVVSGVTPGRAPVVNISVYSMSGQERDTQRYEREWTVPNPITPSLTASISGETITIGGAITVGHFVTLHINNAIVASYAATATDTLTSIAAALTAQLVSQGIVATSSQSIITLQTDLLIARTGCPQTAYLEIDRTMQRFCVTIWAPNNSIRAAVAKVIRPAIAAVDFMTMPDGYAAWLRYESTTDIDRSGKQSLSCRDIHYWVEYAITQSKTVFTLTTFVNQIMARNITFKAQPLPWTPGEFVPDVTTTS